MKISRVSGQETHFTCAETASADAPSSQPSSQPGDYIACLYDGRWWIGSVCSISEEHDDVQVNFMHPHGPAPAFKWPQREDVSWVDKQHILCKIQAPITTTGRSYDILKEDLARIQNQYSRLHSI